MAVEESSEPTAALVDAVDASPEDLNVTIAASLKSSAKVSKKKKLDSFLDDWKRNVASRLGAAQVGDDSATMNDGQLQTTVNPDWYLTKTKTANLFSLVPPIYGDYEDETYKAAIPPFLKSVNYELGEKRASAGFAMEEVLNDVTNMAGVGAVIVTYSARFEKVTVIDADSIPGPQGPIQVSSIPPEMQTQIIEMAKASGVPVKTKEIDRPTDYKFGFDRLSPSDLLWPSKSTGSNFDAGDWIGRAGRYSWAVAKNELRLTDEQKSSVLGNSAESYQNSARDDRDSPPSDLEEVEFQEIYYWRHRYDPNEKSFCSIWKIVFVDGIDKPTIHESWKGQQYIGNTRKYVGARRFPIQVLTITYISDNPVPPSDSAATRPQREDLQRSRSQMFMNRERNVPMRWHNTDRLDPEISDLIGRGGWMMSVPVQGNGDAAFGQIAPGAFPPENNAFDETTNRDISLMWQLGSDQTGGNSTVRRTGTEVTVGQQNFTTRIGQERAKVTAFFLGAVEVLMGLMVLYSDYPNLSPAEKQQMSAVWDNKAIISDVVLKVMPGSTIIRSAEERIEQIFRTLNMTVKSGYVNPQSMIEEAILLSGFDPKRVIITPQPHEEKPTVSLRLSGAKDMSNPMVLAMLIKDGLAPSPDEIEQAKKLWQAAQMPAVPEQPQLPGMLPQGQMPAQSQQPTPAQVEAHPDWHTASKVAQRSRDATGGGESE